ncbi:MAG TPA: hypothetical protein GX708_22640 [Gallicola sp.]|nr:hypothetical protein [Gallicola sp.]
MNKLLRVMFIILIIAFLGAAIMQIFFPEAMGANSEYGISIGWQREIGFWNLAILPILVGINIKYDYFFLKVIVISLIIGGLGFGTNHLIGYINNSSKIICLIGALENYTLVILWIVGLKIEYKIQKTQTGDKHD